MNGKGDRPRPVDPEKWENYFKRTNADYCRFHHMHGVECHGYEACKPCNGHGLTPEHTTCVWCKGRGVKRKEE